MWDTIDTAAPNRTVNATRRTRIKPVLAVLGCAAGFWAAVIGGIALAAH